MILVTGGTGTLGRDVVPTLKNRGMDVAVLSRTPGDGRRVADLATGAGLDAALDGVDTIVHLAAGKDQPGEARQLVAAAGATGIHHLVFISIVGIDRIPYAYYRQKLAAERIIDEAAVPSTIVRTTQFHDFVVNVFFAPQRRLPVIFTPRLSIQPIDTRVVAERLADLALDSPRGRVSDFGGPEVLTGLELARVYSPKRAIPFSLPGKTWSAFAAGHHLVPQNRAGGRTFAEFLT